MPLTGKREFVCERCGYSYPVEDMGVVDGLCINCVDNYYRRCSGCGRRVESSEGDEYEGEFLCHPCLSMKIAGIHSYYYKPTNRFFYGEEESYTRDMMFCGMELEVYVLSSENVLDIARSIKDRHEYNYYFKKDSSIGRGFEIVTHPRTFKSWEEYWDVFNLQVLLPLRRLGCIAHNAHSCGIHIHTSLRAWEGDHLYRCFSLFYNPANYHNLRIVAQRRGSNLNHYASLSTSDIGKFKRHIKDKRSPFHGHYAALNITKDTLEIRIFNSNLRIERVRKNMEFVQAVYEYTKQAQRVSWRGLLKYIKEHRHALRYLYSFMEEKNLLNIEIDVNADIDFEENEGIRERVNDILHGTSVMEAC